MVKKVSLPLVLSGFAQLTISDVGDPTITLIPAGASGTGGQTEGLLFNALIRDFVKQSILLV